MKGKESHPISLIRYDCKLAPLNSGNISNGWWQDRHDELHFYWSGDGDMEHEMDYEGYCYCHNHDSCISNDIKVSSGLPTDLDLNHSISMFSVTVMPILKSGAQMMVS